MKLNTRHKIVWVMTLTVAGTALIAGASLNVSLGFLMIGAALSVATGSETATRIWTKLNSIAATMIHSGTAFRFLLVLSLGGAAYAALAVSTNVNSFIECLAGATFGLWAGIFWRQISITTWKRFLVGFSGMFAYLLVALLLFSSIANPSVESGRAGEILVYSTVAVALGVWWLPKGLRLIRQGITENSDPPVGRPSEQSIFVLYMGLLIACFLSLFLLGSSTFLSFSDSVAPLATQAGSEAGWTKWLAVFVAFSAWMYACWKGILQREPNSLHSNLIRHRIVSSVLGTVAVSVITAAVIFGVQNGHDRIETQRILDTTKNFKIISEQIQAIRGRELETTQDYIQAYRELKPLIGRFEKELDAYSASVDRTNATDRRRGLINIQRFYRNNNSDVWDGTRAMIVALRKWNALMKEEISAIEEMSYIAPPKQPEFWETRIHPLLNSEAPVHNEILSAQSKINSGLRR